MITEQDGKYYLMCNSCGCYKVFKNLSELERERVTGKWLEVYHGKVRSDICPSCKQRAGEIKVKADVQEKFEDYAEKDLKKCPFCGSKEIERWKSENCTYYKCAVCGARGGLGVDKENAKFFWNKRAE